MNKFIKCWVFILCLLFIFLIIFTDRVNADVIPYNAYFDLTLSNNNGWTKDARNYRKSLSNVEGWRQQVLELNSSFKTNLNNYDYAYITASLIYTNNNESQSITINSINFTETCANYSGVTSGTTGYTIYYQDGSTASISGSTRDIICTQYQNIANNISGSTISVNIDKSPMLNVGIRKNGQNIMCENVGNALYRCPKYSFDDSNVTSYLIFDTYIGGYGGTYNLYLYEYMYFTNDSATTIINNQNQNTQTIHNDNQQQYNFISNSNIDSTTTNDINNIDTSNSDTKNAVTNFALIPLNFMQSIINSFSSSCSQVCIGQCGGSSGGGHDNSLRFIFPCLDIESIVGSNIYTIIDSLFAFGMIFAFIRSVRNFFINALLLTTDASSEVGVFL